MTKIALWDESLVDHFARSVSELSENLSLDLLRVSRRACRDRLISGDVDLALIPILTALNEPDLFDVMPAVALSSWANPFMRLKMGKSLDNSVETIAIDPAFPQEALLTKIILKEHYNVQPVFHPYPDASQLVLDELEEEALLVVSTSPGSGADEGFSLDMGRDWFELTHYPMVWGVFAVRIGEGSDERVHLLRTLAQYTELYSPGWLEEDDLPESVAAFFREGVRYRLDDLATAGITSLQDYLFYIDAIEEINPLPLYSVTDEQGDDEDTPLL